MPVNYTRCHSTTTATPPVNKEFNTNQAPNPQSERAAARLPGNVLVDGIYRSGLEGGRDEELAPVISVG